MVPNFPKTKRQKVREQVGRGAVDNGGREPYWLRKNGGNLRPRQAQELQEELS